MTSPEEFEKEVREITDRLANFLIEKNKSYGNSALDPVRIFSSSSTMEQILVRLDDKLSRIKKSGGLIEMGKDGENEYLQEDVVLDIMGYLIILEIKLRQEKEAL